MEKNLPRFLTHGLDHDDDQFLREIKDVSLESAGQYFHDNVESKHQGATELNQEELNDTVIEQVELWIGAHHDILKGAWEVPSKKELWKIVEASDLITIAVDAANAAFERYDVEAAEAFDE